jgi:cell division FtsZ-interacting protein ZapD
MNEQQIERSDMLVDQIYDMVTTADHVDSVYVFRNLFARIGKDCIQRGEVVNDLVRGICDARHHALDSKSQARME